MSKSRMVWEAQKREAEAEIAFERRVGFRAEWEESRDDLRDFSLDSRVDLAGMASVFLHEES